jgi:hypothetical protein
MPGSGVCNPPCNVNKINKIDGPFGVVVGILAFYTRGREFDSRTVQTFVCMNMSVCTGSGCFYVRYNMYVFTKKYIFKYVFIRYLESITQAL